MPHARRAGRRGDAVREAVAEIELHVAHAFAAATSNQVCAGVAGPSPLVARNASTASPHDAGSDSVTSTDGITDV